MKLLGVGLQLMKARCGAGNGRPSYSCCPEMQDTIPYCPKKPFWNFKRTLYFSLLTFGAGIYTGIYISQNYEVPRVDDPQKLVQRMNEKIRELIDDNKKK
ncbi:uncharacterized protein LOC108153010 isoform X2 [Drosophila miranda]|nr:uncharacterized protein LOC4813491 isoform X2 [Drosophila pseudoobscura]XP_026845271.1 uncharacterized protein LOC6596138 isoform X2 [Drosophila persimilis]XP_033243389.1 uncharacterized protein LOC108153010 isoform X2 [Drosophila miranda]